MSQEIHGSFSNPWFDVTPAMDSTSDITVYKSNWDKYAWEHVRQQEPLRLHVFGPDALVFSETLRAEARTEIPWTGITEIDRAMAEAERRRRRGGDGGEATRTTLSDDSLIAAIVAARLLGGTALLAVLALCLHAIDRGYEVDIELNNKGPMPWEQELIYHLTPK